MARFEAHLVERGLSYRYLLHLRPHARQFLEYISRRRLDLNSVQPAHVAAYFQVALRIYKKRVPNRLRNKRYWRKISKRSVDALLRFFQGEWPPGSAPAPILKCFEADMERLRYSRKIWPSRLSAARQFLRHLRQQGRSIEETRPSDVQAFLQVKLERYQNKHGGLPKQQRRWGSQYRGPINQLIRMVQPQWPPPEPPANDCEQFQREVCDGYGRWLTEVQGLSKWTRLKNGDAARLFLRWLGEGADRESLCRLSVSDIDAYLEWRMPGLRRVTRWGICSCLRSFLRYLQVTEITPGDLSSVVSGPPLYKFEEIPRAFTDSQVETLLEATRHDPSPTGLRDYALLMLFATYGLRAGEVVRLRLEDIDWRGERLRVRQSKTGVESFLPLVPQVGDALLEYLQRGRPETTLREVFLRACAPHGPFGSVASIASMISSRLKKAGVEVKGRHGSHAFRFARAASLLQASVSLKSIGDLLGHYTASSTAIYYAQRIVM